MKDVFSLWCEELGARHKHSLFCSSVFRPACECFQPGQEEMDWHTFCSDVLPVLHSDVNLRI